ncbi:MAG: aminopeptidase, partial [Acidobacteria bacterium]
VVAHTVSSDALYAQYHRPGDEPGILDYGHMADAIASLIDPIRWLLDSDYRPRWMPGGKP